MLWWDGVTVVDVEKDEANSVGGSDVDSRRRAAGNLEVLKVELKQIVARPYIKTKSVCSSYCLLRQGGAVPLCT